VVGLGITALLFGRRRWHVGWPLVLLGLGSLVVLGQLHLVGAAGSFTSDAFGYLLPHHRGPFLATDVVRGLLVHPWLARRALAKSVPLLLLFLLPSGLLGAASRSAIGMELAVLLPPALAHGPHYSLLVQEAFQVWPALPFVLIGTVGVLSSGRWPRAATGRAVPLATGTCLLLAALTAVVWLPPVFSAWVPATAPGETALLARLERSVPRSNELVVWGSIAGRFGRTADLHPVFLPSMLLPVNEQSVTFVLAPGKLDIFFPVSTEAFFARRLVSIDHASVALDRDGVLVLRWHPAARVRSIRFPSAAPITTGPRVIPVFGPLSP